MDPTRIFFALVIGAYLAAAVVTCPPADPALANAFGAAFSTGAARAVAEHKAGPDGVDHAAMNHAGHHGLLSAHATAAPAPDDTQPRLRAPCMCGCGSGLAAVESPATGIGVALIPESDLPTAEGSNAGEHVAVQASHLDAPLQSDEKVPISA